MCKSDMESNINGTTGNIHDAHANVHDTKGNISDSKGNMSLRLRDCGRLVGHNAVDGMLRPDTYDACSADVHRREVVSCSLRVGFWLCSACRFLVQQGGTASCGSDDDTVNDSEFETKEDFEATLKQIDKLRL